MKLVIDIDEEDYKLITEHYSYELSHEFTDEIFMRIENGTPLPKGHGRLIDADKLQHEINNDKREAFSKHEVWLLLSTYNDNLLTIIEADRSEVVNEDKNCRPIRF